MTLFEPPQAGKRAPAPGEGKGGSAEPAGAPLERGDLPAAHDGPLVRVRMTLAYDGSAFHGFAAQPGQRTVGGTLADAIGRVLGHAVSITCAGRTDTGVHALGQVVHFDVPGAALKGKGAGAHGAAGGVERLAVSCNRMLAPEVVVTAACVAGSDFDARSSALSRSYRYTILNSPLADPFCARTAWHVADPLDLKAMRVAADPLIGEHDFSAFCRRARGREQSLVRRVLDASWGQEGGAGSSGGGSLLRFDVEATSFCHQMVRSLVGTMVEMGNGRRQPGDMSWILRSCDRSLAGSPAPPHGLCLREVRYPSQPPPP